MYFIMSKGFKWRKNEGEEKIMTSKIDNQGSKIDFTTRETCLYYELVY